MFPFTYAYNIDNVFYTTKDAANLGYKTFVVEDATKYIDATNYLKAKQEMSGLGIEIIESEILK